MQHTSQASNQQMTGKINAFFQWMIEELEEGDGVSVNQREALFCKFVTKENGTTSN